MIGDQARKDAAFLFWCGEKARAGHSLTPEEARRFDEAHGRTRKILQAFFRLTDDQLDYTPGMPFKEP